MWLEKVAPRPDQPKTRLRPRAPAAHHPNQHPNDSSDIPRDFLRANEGSDTLFATDWSLVCLADN